MCGFKKIDFEKYMPFKDHLHEHDPWKYINLLFYLKIKNPNDYTGHENYIHKRQQNKQVSWIPIGKTMTLQENEDDEMKEVLEEMKNLQKSVKEMKELK